MEWLNINFPNLRVVDVECTMVRYEFPPEVCKFILKTWTKNNDENGGTYTKPIDQLNHTAMYVLKNEGLENAANHMMKMSGMDYGRMRMDYG